VFGTVFLKASAKVLLFSELAKFFANYFQKKLFFPGLDDQNQGKSAIYGQYEQDVAKMAGIGGCGGFAIYNTRAGLGSNMDWEGGGLFTRLAFFRLRNSEW
jgi:hypothetical protein